MSIQPVGWATPLPVFSTVQVTVMLSPPWACAGAVTDVTTRSGSGARTSICARLVVVALEVVGVVGVDVDRQLVLEDGREQVGPGGDVVGAGVEIDRAG